MNKKIFFGKFSKSFTLVIVENQEKNDFSFARTSTTTENTYISHMILWTFISYIALLLQSKNIFWYIFLCAFIINDICCNLVLVF